MVLILPNRVREIVVLIEVILSIGVCLPLVIYFYKKLNTISYSVMVQKRHPEILKIQGWCTIIWFGLNYPIAALDWADLDQLKGYQQELIRRFNLSTWILPPFCAFVAITFRLWHVYFDLKHSSSQKNSEWKYHLDPDLVVHNFWLTHKKDYGSWQFTRKYGIVYFIVNIILMIIVYQILIPTHYYPMSHFFAACLFGILSVCMVAIYCRMPEYDDHFFIKYELKIISIVMVIVMSIVMIFIVIGFLSTLTTLMMLIGIAGTGLMFSLDVVSFWYIPRIIRAEQIQHNLAKLQSHCTNSNESSVRTQERSRGNSDNPNHLQLGPIVRRLSSNGQHHQLSGQKQSYKLHVILSNEIGLKLFMQHLAKEFSMECLLCFVETIQYKFAFKKRCDLINCELIDDDMDVSQPPMAEAAPMSFIVKTGFDCVSKYKQNDDPATVIKESKNVCLKLFQKYIDIGSELEVNISYETRTRLKNLMSNKSFFMEANTTANDLFKIFDDVSTEMFRLMHGAYVRFKTKTSFNDVVQALHSAHDGM